MHEALQLIPKEWEKVTLIADLTCFPHRWRRGCLVWYKDTSPECILAEKKL